MALYNTEIFGQLFMPEIFIVDYLIVDHRLFLINIEAINTQFGYSFTSPRQKKVKEEFIIRLN